MIFKPHPYQSVAIKQILQHPYYGLLFGYGLTGLGKNSIHSNGYRNVNL